MCINAKLGQQRLMETLKISLCKIEFASAKASVCTKNTNQRSDETLHQGATFIF